MAEVVAKEVLYCKVCSFPPEYCEFGVSLKKCQEWLEDANKELYDQLYSEEALSHKFSNTLSLEKQEKIHAELAKKQLKEEAKQERELQRKLQSKITIKRIERNRRKHVITITGLELLDVDLKKLAKQFASKFATGATVSKNAEKKEEILIQGDVSDEAKKEIEKILTDKGLEGIEIEQIDDKKNKKTPAPTTPGAPATKD
ncbi:translation machinery-associated protein 22 [Scheffersomyces coipomensis]|uniref:translation machinery-associated protein 22 n=1 Tax=Scheffersomyces coipomensis TaxID=1788519 RepID=UPI00315DD54E